jgi:putative DNA primase/helicase
MTMFVPLADAGRGGPSKPPAQAEIIMPVPEDFPEAMPRHTFGAREGTWAYRNAAGALLHLVDRFRAPDGGKTYRPRVVRREGGGALAWAFAGPPEPRPLYGLDALAARPDAPILVCEGEKAADAAQRLFPDHVATTSSGGAAAAGKAEWGALKGRAVTIWPDHDAPGARYAQEAAGHIQAAGAQCVRIVQVPEAFPDAWDLADPVPNNANLRALLAAAQSAPPEPYMPKGYAIKDGQLCFLGGDEPKPFADPLHVLAMTRAEGGQDNWGRLVAFTNPDGQDVQWAMPASMLAGDGAEYRRVLLDKGHHTRGGKASQTLLHNYLSDARPTARAVAVSKPGWHKGRYVAADGTVYGQGADRVLLQIPGTTPAWETSGTLEGWQSTVGTWAEGKARFTLALCAAFMGPLLKPAGAERVGFHFVGGSSCGKSTALEVAAGMWGRAPDSWRSTDNGAEGTAELANDGFLALDELGQADGRAVDAMAYMLANGQGKRRAHKSGGAREIKSWRVAFLSSGEVGVADKLAEVGKRHKAGQAVRVLEVPADSGAGHGLFESLHGHTGGAAFSAGLKDAARRHCGHAMPAFLEHLAIQPPEVLAETLSALRDAWCAQYVPQGADAQVGRAANAFALAACAGHLATLWGVVPWPEGWAGQAAAACFADWIAQRGGTGSHEVREGLEAIAAFIRAHGAARFQDKDNKAEKVINRAGFRESLGEGEGCAYLMFPDTMRKEVLGGSKNVKSIMAAAIERGMVVPDKEGKSTQLRHIPALGRSQRVYVVQMTGEEEATQ